MTLKRLMIAVGVLVLIVTITVVALWQYTFAPQGRARNIIITLRGDSTGLRVWLLNHHLAPPVVFDMPPDGRRSSPRPSSLPTSAPTPCRWSLRHWTTDTRTFVSPPSSPVEWSTTREPSRRLAGS